MGIQATGRCASPPCAATWKVAGGVSELLNAMALARTHGPCRGRDLLDALRAVIDFKLKAEHCKRRPQLTCERAM